MSTTYTETSAAAGPSGRTAASSRQIPIVLTTTLGGLQIPQQPYLVPTTWRRTHLSSLVNRLLNSIREAGDVVSATAASIPFDFIVRSTGEILRSSVQDWLDANGRTEEETLELEYIRSTLPPRFTAAFEQDDWISCVDASRDGFFLTSSYDGTLRLFGESGISALMNHRIPSGVAGLGLTGARFVVSHPASSSAQILASGMDGKVHLLDTSLPSSTEVVEGQASSTQLIASGVTSSSLGQSPISCLNVAPSQDVAGWKALTGAWDGSVSFWDSTSLVDAPSTSIELQSKKRRKAEKGSIAAGENVEHTGKILKSKATLWHAAPNPAPPGNLPPAIASSAPSAMPSSNARVGGVAFDKNREGFAYSAGWNGSVREWDLEIGTAVGQKTCDRPILSMTHLAPSGSTAALLTSHMDRSLALWDPRSASLSALSVNIAGAAAGPISTLSPHPTSSHLFAAGSHDGALKLWDIRSPKSALFSLKTSSSAAPGQENLTKVLTVDWDRSGQVLVCGGEDKKLTVHRGEGIGRNDLAKQ
ncbi:microtubule binding protein ytm1 [Ceraceosorus bombacis]|uniref:Microtubule binding protein ytm1 n=1 Tax=Ceraceosorus bombacis TaxID=401625 RepID=A0A0P1B9G1_9BASI|nr:microtubule binding protein ytm1 [Ceraceosorus bombacis]